MRSGRTLGAGAAASGWSGGVLLAVYREHGAEARAEVDLVCGLETLRVVETRWFGMNSGIRCRVGQFRRGTPWASGGGAAGRRGGRRRRRRSAATFVPHPRAVLEPGSEPRLLTTLELRREELLGYGADEVRAYGSTRRSRGESRGVRARRTGRGDRGVGRSRWGELPVRAQGGRRLPGVGRLMRGYGGEAYSVPVRSEDGRLRSARRASGGSSGGRGGRGGEASG